MMKENPIQILLVEDNPGDVRLVREILREVSDIKLDASGRLTDALNRLKLGGVDLVLLDLGLPDSQGLKTLVELREIYPLLPMIVLTGLDDGDVALEAVKAGAQDYLVKGHFDEYSLPRAVRYAIERNHIEQELRESENRFRSTLDNMLEGCQIIGFDWRYHYMNHTAIAQGKLTGKLPLNRTMMEVYPGIENTVMFGYLRRCMEERKPHQMENEFTFPDSSKGWFMLNIQPVPEGVFVLSIDITETKRVERELATSESKLRAVFAAMQDAVMVIDKEGVYREIAPTDPSLLIHPPDELLGKSLWDVFPREQAEEFYKVFQTVLKKREACRIEYQLQIKDRNAWFSTIITPMGDDATVCVAHDITERIQAEKEIQNRLAELEVVNKISTALRVAQKLEDMLPRLLEETLSVLNTDAGMIWLTEDHHEPDVTRGWFTQMTQLPQNTRKGITEYVISTGKTYLSSEFINDGLLMGFFNGAIPAGWGGACIPIRTAQDIVGILFISVQLPRILQPDEVRLLTTLAEIAGNAIHRMRLHEQTELQVQRLATLHAIDIAISSSLDLRFTLNIFLMHMTTQLGVDAADVLLLEPNSNTLEYTAGRGFRNPNINRTHLRVGEGHAGEAALERCTISVPNITTSDPPFVRTNLIKGEDFISYYAVPLIAKGQVLGVLEFFNRSQLNPDEEWLDFLETLSGQAAIAIDNAQLYEELQCSNAELKLAYETTIEGWSAALDLRDKETEGHTLRVTQLTLKLAQAMGFSDQEMIHIRRGALLHDIGKMGVPDQILLKPGKLTDEEWEIMHQHPVFAYELLKPIAYLRPALDIPYCHHEKWDGTGYPRGLKGKQIPLAARLFAVVDIWDALRSNRPYRKSWPEEKVFNYIRELSGTHLDPMVVELFFEIMGKKTENQQDSEQLI